MIHALAEVVLNTRDVVESNVTKSCYGNPLVKLSSVRDHLRCPRRKRFVVLLQSKEKRGSQGNFKKNPAEKQDLFFFGRRV